VKKVLVTGGTGFIGSNLVKALIKRGCQVRVFDNDFRGSTENLREVTDRIEWMVGDVRSADEMRQAVEGVDTVFHLAYINGTELFYKYPRLVLDVAVRGQLNMIDAAEDSGVENFVYASSSEVYQTALQIPTPEEVPLSVPSVANPRYSYGGGKIIAELLLLHYANPSKMKRIIFRPHNIYGPVMGFEHVIPQLVAKMFVASRAFTLPEAQITIQGMGDETRAFCFIDDAVEGILLSADRGSDGDIFHVGRDEETTILDLAFAIGEACGVKAKISSGPLVQGSTKRRCPDISRLRSLGYCPRTCLKEGLGKTVAWYKGYFIKSPPGERRCA